MTLKALLYSTFHTVPFTEMIFRAYVLFFVINLILKKNDEFPYKAAGLDLLEYFHRQKDFCPWNMTFSSSFWNNVALQKELWAGGGITINGQKFICENALEVPTCYIFQFRAISHMHLCTCAAF